MNSQQQATPLAVILLFSILTLSCSSSQWAAFLKELSNGSDIPTLNHTIIFDLFMNYELSEKNGDLSVILNYIPEIDGKLVSKIVLEGETAGNSEFISFEYAETGTLTDILYQTDSDGIRRASRTQYKIFYMGDLPDRIEIAGEPKIEFNYDSDGRIERISRLWNDDSMYEYIFEYNMTEAKADITLYVTENDSRTASNTYFVQWNEDFRLEGFKLDIYSADSFTYTTEDYILKSMNYNRANASNSVLTWEYTFDESNNWVTRNSEDTYAEREITYR